MIPILAAEASEKTLWYPTILGFLVVLFAVGLFCGSVYLLLSTNLGARLGFLIAFTGLMGFMVILTSLWMLTSSPVNTLRGRLPGWKAQEIVSAPSDSKIDTIHNVTRAGRKADAAQAADVKAAADEELVKHTALPGEPAEPQEFARFDIVTDYKAVNTFRIGGSEPNPLDFEITHEPLYAVIEFCPVKDPGTPFGVAPPEPECDPATDNQFIVFERDLGSLRVPPLVAFVGSVLLFGLGLLTLHWREKDEQAVARSLTPATVDA